MSFESYLPRFALVRLVRWWRAKEWPGVPSSMAIGLIGMRLRGRKEPRPALVRQCEAVLERLRVEMLGAVE